MVRLFGDIESPGSELIPSNSIQISPEFTDSLLSKTFSSIKAAVEAVTPEAEELNPYELVIAPGSYNEDPFTLPSHVRLRGGMVGPSVLVTANDPDEDLITVSGVSSIEGITFLGVTNPDKSVINIDGIGYLFNGSNLSFYGCSNGIYTANNAVVILNDLFELLLPVAYGGTEITSQPVGTLVWGEDDAQIMVHGFVIEIPVSTGFAEDPIKYCFNINHSRLDLVGGSFGVPNITTDQRILNLNNYARVNLFNTKFRNTYTAIHVNSTVDDEGKSTEVFGQGCTFEECTNDIVSELSTAQIRFLGSSTDEDDKVHLPAGGEDYFSGILGETDEGTTDLYGPIRLGYIEKEGKYIRLNQGISDALSTGPHGSNPTYVTHAVAMNVNVESGHGIVHTNDDEFAWRVDWVTTNDFTVTGSIDSIGRGTSWVYVDGNTSLVCCSASEPSDVEHVVLAKIFYVNGEIYAIHNYARPVTHSAHILNDLTRSLHKIVANSGLIVSGGGSDQMMNITQGSYWIGTNLISVEEENNFNFREILDNGRQFTASKNDIDTTSYDGITITGSMVKVNDGLTPLTPSETPKNYGIYAPKGAGFSGAVITDVDRIDLTVPPTAVVGDKIILFGVSPEGNYTVSEIGETYIKIAEGGLSAGPTSYAWVIGAERITGSTAIVLEDNWVDTGYESGIALFASKGDYLIFNDSLAEGYAITTQLPLDADYFRTDTVFVTSDGKKWIVQGTAQYDTSEAAVTEDRASAVTFIEDTAIPVAKIVVKQGLGPVYYEDCRPFISFGVAAQSGGTPLLHSSLGGLGADDHGQYLLANGNRSMGGSLDMSSNDIVDVNTVNNVVVEAHMDRHLPGGADELTVDVPVDVGSENLEGDAASFARSNHQHYWGSTINGLLVGGAAHIASTSNPHTVTKSQVGLGSVTNDAQLKRADGDIASFTEKTNIALADLVLIEDSAATNAKKKVQVTNLPGATGWENLQYTEDETVTTTTSTTYVDSASPTGNRKLRLTFTPPIAGDYMIEIMMLVTSSATNRLCSVRSQLDDTTDILPEVTRTAGAAGEYVGVRAFKKVTLTAAQHTVDIDFRLNSGTATISAKSARITARRVA